MHLSYQRGIRSTPLCLHRNSYHPPEIVLIAIKAPSEALKGYRKPVLLPHYLASQDYDTKSTVDILFKVRWVSRVPTKEVNTMSDIVRLH